MRYTKSYDSEQGGAFDRQIRTKTISQNGRSGGCRGAFIWMLIPDRKQAGTEQRGPDKFHRVCLAPATASSRLLRLFFQHLLVQKKDDLPGVLRQGRRDGLGGRRHDGLLVRVYRTRLPSKAAARSLQERHSVLGRRL